MRGRLILVVVWTAINVIGASSARSTIVDASPPVPESWQRLGSLGGRGARSSALAQSKSGDLAVGDEAGVSWWRKGTPERAALPLVRDLAFDSEGALWIGTLDGLFFWKSNGRPTRRRLEGGEAANRIARIAVSNSTLLVATGAGAFWSSAGRIFQPLRAAPIASAITHVAILPAGFDRVDRGASQAFAGIAQAWLYGAGRLSVVHGLETPSGLRVTNVETVSLPLPRPNGERDLVDLLIDPMGRRLHLVFEDSIAWRSMAREASTARWRFERPNLPPGASIRALGWASGRIWIATDHGLLVGETLSGPFRRAASPVGTTNCVDVQASAHESVLALCRQGVFALSRVGTAAALTSIDDRERSEVDLPPDPPLAEIRRRAFSRSGLTVARSSGLWDGLKRRAFWPEVELRFDLDLDYDEESDSDQAFISGDMRHLFDRTRDEGQQYHAAIKFDWDLGGVVYPLESVDLSRELRQVVTLRDDVADEINQLYFERQAIRESLSSARPGESGEAGETDRLKWRAQELDAGLDAWTGGWISRWRASRAISKGHSNDPENTIHPETRKLER